MKKLNIKKMIVVAGLVLGLGAFGASNASQVKADTYTNDEIKQEFKEDRQKATQEDAGKPGAYPDLATNTDDNSGENPWNSNIAKQFHFEAGVTYVDQQRGLSFRIKRESNYGDGYIYKFIIKSVHAAWVDYGENDNEDGQSYRTGVTLETDETTPLKKLPKIDDDKVQAFHFENGVNYVDRKNGVSVFFTAFEGNDFDNGNTYNFDFYSKKIFISDYEESQDIVKPAQSKKEDDIRESYKVVDKINTSKMQVW